MLIVLGNKRHACGRNSAAGRRLCAIHNVVNVQPITMSAVALADVNIHDTRRTLSVLSRWFIVRTYVRIHSASFIHSSRSFRISCCQTRVATRRACMRYDNCATTNVWSIGKSRLSVLARLDDWAARLTTRLDCQLLPIASSCCVILPTFQKFSLYVFRLLLQLASFVQTENDVWGWPTAKYAATFPVDSSRIPEVISSATNDE